MLKMGTDGRHRLDSSSPGTILPTKTVSICDTNFAGYPDEKRVSLLKKLNWLLHTKGEGQTIMFDYCRMRFYGPEYNYLRTVCLNLETMEASFPDGTGQVWVHSLDTFLSIMNTQTPGILQLDLRLNKLDKKLFGYPDGKTGPFTNAAHSHTRTKVEGSFSETFSSIDRALTPIAEETRLKEQKWCFQPAEDANYFAKIIHLMITRGPDLYEVFLALDRDKKGFINVADLEAAVEEITDPEIKSQFSPLGIVRMVADADPTNIDRVRFNDFFSFLVFSSGEVHMTTEKYLLTWMRVAQFRIDDQIERLLSEIKAVVPAAENPKFACAESNPRERQATFFSHPCATVSPEPRVRSGRMVLTHGTGDEIPTFVTSSPRVKARRRSTLGVTIALKELDLPEEDHSQLLLNAITEDLGEDIHKNTLRSAEKMSTADIQQFLFSVAETAQSDEAIDVLHNQRHRSQLQSTLNKLKEKYLLNIETTLLQKQAHGDGKRETEIAFLRRGTVAQLQILKLKAAEEARRAKAIANEVRVLKKADDLNMPRMREGETLVHKCESCIVILSTNKSFAEARNDIALRRLGNVYMTTLRLCFISEDVMVESEDSIPIITNRMEVSLGSIKRIDLLDVKESLGYHLSIECKDHRALYISFPDEKGEIFGKLFHDVIEKYTHSKDVTNLYAFGVKKHEFTDNLMFASSFDGWNVFDPEEEYRRQGLLLDEGTGSVRSSRNNSIHQADYPQSLPGSVRTERADHNATQSTKEQAAKEKHCWRLWKDNYSLVQSYPDGFIVPAQLSDEEIADAAQYRSRHRMPAVTWGAPGGAVLARSSQPMSGITASRSLADKLLLNLLRTKGKLHSEEEQQHPSKFYIVDCRSRMAATANAALGKGVENDKKLVRTRVVFCGIANIHTMRDSYAALGKLLSPGAVTKQAHSIHLPKSLLASIRSGFHWTGLIQKDKSAEQFDEKAEKETENTRETMTRMQIRPESKHEVSLDPEAGQAELQLIANFDFGVKLEETGWLDHVRLVISSSIMVADKLYHENSSVLVHCSDGWDRTAQVCSTSQLILDPYFRSLEGFFVLIEKDWTGFGHKFQDRVGHGVDFAKSNENLKEVSPVFLQWLDVVRQMLQQFPKQFEFNEMLLIFILDSLYSNISGTFLGNSEYERKQQLHCDTKTNSLWESVMRNRKDFINPAYLLHDGPLWPTIKRVNLWERLYCRYLAEFHPKVISGESWIQEEEEEEDHADGAADAEQKRKRHPAAFEEIFYDTVASDWVGIAPGIYQSVYTDSAQAESDLTERDSRRSP